jgi:hypothetical protein
VLPERGPCATLTDARCLGFDVWILLLGMLFSLCY